MTVQAIRKQTPPLQFDLDHSAQVLETISAVTVDPYKGALFYFIPFLKAFSSSHVEMRENDPAQEAMMPSPTKSLILREIHELKLYGPQLRLFQCRRLSLPHEASAIHSAPAPFPRRQKPLYARNGARQSVSRSLELYR